MAEKLTVRQQQALDEERDAKIRNAEETAPTTKTSMGEDAGAFLRNMFGSKASTPKPAPESVGNKAEILKNAAQAETDLRNYTTDLTLMDRSKIPPPDAQAAAQKEMYGKMVRGAEHGFKPNILPGSNYGYATPPQWKGIEQSRKQGGSIKAYAKGGSIRGGGCETKGKTKGRMV
jgi:hypothetical protein